MLTKPKKEEVKEIATKFSRLDKTNRMMVASSIQVLLLRQEVDKQAEDEPTGPGDKKSA